MRIAIFPLIMEGSQQFAAGSFNRPDDQVLKKGLAVENKSACRTAAGPSRSFLVRWCPRISLFSRTGFLQ